MVDPYPTSRRSFLAGVSAAALIPGQAWAQAAPTFEDFAARARALSGFDPVPRSLLTGARGVLDDMQATAFAEGHGAADAVTKTVLRALYTGRHMPRDGDMERFAYADALMYAAIEDSVNVPSYCGGVPAYWAEKPRIT
ncbi:sugar dehydrogenase complex small subunit [uncultured Tateyamaria sp.]|uniref:sugar dehydrogenase complex small subunit n=1 Tax=uncultured Tateyamaria sp. TaxID=455651 RepID=UPI002628F974|nr:sugar dehydrogenase complex small subunit [uncultured Tateyamaria sp.]